MGTDWHEPRYIKVDRSLGHNQNVRKGKSKKNTTVSRKVLWDRYLQARKELWFNVISWPNSLFWNTWRTGWTKKCWKDIAELETEFIRRSCLKEK